MAYHSRPQLKTGKLQQFFVLLKTFVKVSFGSTIRYLISGEKFDTPTNGLFQRSTEKEGRCSEQRGFREKTKVEI